MVSILGSMGIATVSDSLISFAGEWLLNQPNRRPHIGFIEKWWLVRLQWGGIVLAYFYPLSKIAHAGHILMSTYASLFHITMASGGIQKPLTYAATGAFLVFAAWLPAWIGDILLPMFFVKKLSGIAFANIVDYIKKEDAQAEENGCVS